VKKVAKNVTHFWALLVKIGPIGEKSPNLGTLWLMEPYSTRPSFIFIIYLFNLKPVFDSKEKVIK
jgi:hypothetical protein